MTHSLPEVRQLIPADGWFGKFVIADAEGDLEWNRPLIAWAVLAEPVRFGGRSITVVGLVANTYIEPCERDKEFAGYYHHTELAEEEAARISREGRVNA